MPKLVKEITTEYIPPSPGMIYTPAMPAYTAIEAQQVCTANPVTTTTLVDPDTGQVTILQSWGEQTCTTEYVPVYHEATAGTSYSPPTAEQTVVVTNPAWDTYARTIDKLLPGYAVEFTVRLGTYGALVAVGTIGMEGAPFNGFHYGVLVDTSGIFVMENGAKGATLAASNSPGLKIRITRQSDGRIFYTCGSTTVVSARTDYGVYEDLYVYGLLYDDYDEVTTAEFLPSTVKATASAFLNGLGSFTGKPQARVTMPGSGDLLAMFATAVLLDGYGDLTAEFAHNLGFVDATLTGDGRLIATATAGGYGSITLEPFAFLGSDMASEGLGYGYSVLPQFTVTGSEDIFVPAQPTNGYLNLPYFTFFAMGSETAVGTGSTSLPQYLTQASEGDYGIGSFSLAQPRFIASGGFIADDQMVLLSAGVSSSTYAAALDLVLILNSDGTLSSSLSMTREQALELLSVLQQSDSFAMLGVYGYSVLSGLRGLSLETLSVDGRPDLHAGGAVWVVNLDTSASVQYANYGFNSFFRRGDVYYGVANDGIYQLTGTTDAGSPIEALIEFANTNLGSTQAKRMSDVYLAASGNSLVLKVVTPAGTNHYTARWGGAGMQNQRVHPGKGLQSVYWQFGVLNQDGNDFELAGLEFLPIVTQRRVV